MTEELEPHILTNKDNTKTLPCVECGRPCVVTYFAAPAKIKCLDCKPAKTNQREPGSVAVPQAGRTRPELAANLEDCLINKNFVGAAFCPFDPAHSMELKSIHVSHTHGPRHLMGYDSKGLPTYDQRSGEVAMFQCTECNVMLCYSTQHPRQFRRQNESRVIEPEGSFYEATLGMRDDG